MRLLEVENISTCHGIISISISLGRTVYVQVQHYNMDAIMLTSVWHWCSPGLLVEPPSLQLYGNIFLLTSLLTHTCNTTKVTNMAQSLLDRTPQCGATQLMECPVPSSLNNNMLDWYTFYSSHWVSIPLTFQVWTFPSLKETCRPK